ncbi:hypothetical protein NQ317_002307 [Molorchus minor]|uniref:GRAM domain-containing protein n=1 Tax=Molorchus minor TaxID=1323400 RepID=A0ABQ9J2K7_9CUCU|nr:hypothetical protein NQ317_002307 [Molorchus minor]
MLLHGDSKVFKRLFLVAKMVSVRKSAEEFINSDYDSASTGSNESETSMQLSVSKASSTDSPSTKIAKELKVKALSQSLRKKFFRQFSNVEDNEQVLKRYSCALVGDILLQGHLFVTSNYFAFYSNVFGYVTRILIPILSVEKITKEKTAKILPNAIGIATSESRYVFGSLMSRDNTLEYLTNTWEKVKSEAPPSPMESELVEEEDLGDSSDLGENGSDEMEVKEEPPNEQRNDMRTHSKIIRTVSTFRRIPRFENISIRRISNSSFMLVATTLLLILLYLTAAFLLYRINTIHSRYPTVLPDAADTDSIGAYSDWLQWQAQQHFKSSDAMYAFLDTNLVQIAKDALEQLAEQKEVTLLRGSEGPETYVGVTKGHINWVLNERAHKKFYVYWRRSGECRQAQDFIVGASKTKTPCLLSESRQTLNQLVVFLSVHCMQALHS